MAAEGLAECTVLSFVYILVICEPRRFPVTDGLVGHDTTHSRTTVVGVSRFSL